MQVSLGEGNMDSLEKEALFGMSSVLEERRMVRERAKNSILEEEKD